MEIKVVNLRFFLNTIYYWKCSDEIVCARDQCVTSVDCNFLRKRNVGENLKRLTACFRNLFIIIHMNFDLHLPKGVKFLSAA